MAIRSPHRDALRILFVLGAGGSPIETPAPGDALIFKGEARLQAFDFWMRNPDYLAAELIDLFKETNDDCYYKAAQAIVEFKEPDLRRVPMVRYLFGAFEPLDDALSLLRSRNLVRITGTKGAKNRVLETDFILTTLGLDTCKTAVTQEPILQWYADRAELVAKVAGTKGGTALKQKQYERTCYAATKLGGFIPEITEEVQAQLKQLNTVF